MQCRGVLQSHSLARRCHAKLPISASLRESEHQDLESTHRASREYPIHTQYSIAAAAMSTSRTPFVCASCTRTLRATVKPNAIRSFSTTLAKSAGAPSPDEPRWKQTPPQMRMPFRLRPEPKQPKWEVNEKPELVDEAYDRFVGQTGGKGTRGCELLPEEIKVGEYHQPHD